MMVVIMSKQTVRRPYGRRSILQHVPNGQEIKMKDYIMQHRAWHDRVAMLPPAGWLPMLNRRQESDNYLFGTRGKELSKHWNTSGSGNSLLKNSNFGEHGRRSLILTKSKQPSSCTATSHQRFDDEGDTPYPEHMDMMMEQNMTEGQESDLSAILSTNEAVVSQSSSHITKTNERMTNEANTAACTKVGRKRQPWGSKYSNETVEERRARRMQAREETKAKKLLEKEAETPEQRAERLEKQRERQRRFYARETEEQRQRRLLKARVYHKLKKSHPGLKFMRTGRRGSSVITPNGQVIVMTGGGHELINTVANLPTDQANIDETINGDTDANDTDPKVAGQTARTVPPVKIQIVHQSDVKQFKIAPSQSPPAAFNTCGNTYFILKQPLSTPTTTETTETTSLVGGDTTDIDAQQDLAKPTNPQLN